MASADAWADFEALKHNVRYNTVDRLKNILSSFNDQCHTNFTKSGKKQDLIERITRELDLWRATGNVERWTRAKEILKRDRTAMYGGFRTEGYTSVTPQATYNTGASTSYQSRPAATATINHYDPYARKPAVPPNPSTSAAGAQSIHFKPSPFFRVDQAVSRLIECPESTSQMDRKQQKVMFTIPQDAITKLKSASPKYQLRLYCTSSAYYITNSFRPSFGACPIEFPPTCEVRVNSSQLNVNLKGMKKKPGTAPPPDLGRHIRLDGSTNSVEMVYVNSQQPAPSKKYFMIVMLVEVTTPEQLVERLRKGKFKSSAEIAAKMKQTANQDDDIVAGSQKLTLKCPLSYTRIITPCRSSTCVHSQCFDAFSWFSVMEQTTTWLCPVCEKVLNSEELIVDGFFDDILKVTDEDTEDVIVEADGQWHTSDDKFASPEWKAAHPPKTESAPPTPVKQRSPTPFKPTINGNGAHVKFSPREYVVLDSDDEEEGQVKRELSPSAHRSNTASWASIAGRPPRSQTADSEVIDLTLDSDDEEPPPTQTQTQTQSSQSLSRVPLAQTRSQPAAVSTVGKRKPDDREVISPTEQIWKKSRVDAPGAHPSSVTGSSTASVPYVNGTNGTNGAAYSSPRDPTRTLPTPAPNRYDSPFSRQPAFNNGSYIPPGAAPVPVRPPLATPSYSAPFVGGRTNGASASTTPSTAWRS